MTARGLLAGERELRRTWEWAHDQIQETDRIVAIAMSAVLRLPLGPRSARSDMKVLEWTIREAARSATRCRLKIEGGFVKFTVKATCRTVGQQVELHRNTVHNARKRLSGLGYLVQELKPGATSSDPSVWHVSIPI